MQNRNTQAFPHKHRGMRTIPVEPGPDLSPPDFESLPVEIPIHNKPSNLHSCANAAGGIGVRRRRTSKHGGIVEEVITICI